MFVELLLLACIQSPDPLVLQPKDIDPVVASFDHPPPICETFHFTFPETEGPRLALPGQCALSLSHKMVLDWVAMHPKWKILKWTCVTVNLNKDRPKET